MGATTRWWAARMFATPRPVSFDGSPGSSSSGLRRRLPLQHSPQKQTISRSRDRPASAVSVVQSNCSVHCSAHVRGKRARSCRRAPRACATPSRNAKLKLRVPRDCGRQQAATPPTVRMRANVRLGHCGVALAVGASDADVCARACCEKGSGSPIAANGFCEGRKRRSVSTITSR